MPFVHSALAHAVSFAVVLACPWCFKTLGRHFTFAVQASKDQPVVTADPCRLLRRPSYETLLLIFFGWGFVVDNWGSLVVLTAAVAIGPWARIRAAERTLSHDLGGKYQAFAATRNRLIPFVW